MGEIPEELERWRARRQAELTSAESWLGLVGLFRLEPWLNRAGSADDASVRLQARIERDPKAALGSRGYGNGRVCRGAMALDKSARAFGCGDRESSVLNRAERGVPRTV